MIQRCPILIFIKESLGLSYSPNTVFVMLYFINLTNFIVLIVFTCWDIGHCIYCNYCCSVCDVIKFEINYSFLIKAFFHITRNSGQNYKYLFRQNWCNCICALTKTVFYVRYIWLILVSVLITNISMLNN